MKRKILVVDDIPAVKEFILDALEHDYDVTGVGNGKDALAAMDYSLHGDAARIGRRQSSETTSSYGD